MTWPEVAWKAWAKQQAHEGHFNGPDRVNPEQLNRYDWYSAHDWKVAYPGDSKIYLPDQVLGTRAAAWAFITGTDPQENIGRSARLGHGRLLLRPAWARPR